MLEFSFIVAHCAIYKLPDHLLVDHRQLEVSIRVLRCGVVVIRDVNVCIRICTIRNNTCIYTVLPVEAYRIKYR